MIGSSICLLTIVTALAQAPSDEARVLRTPLLGYLVTESPLHVRPIMGAPGAVTIGEALRIPREVTRFVAAPSQPFGIVERGGEAESGVLRLGASDRGSVQVLPNSFPHFDRIAFSPSGSVAVLYSAAMGRAQVISGLPANPQVDAPIDVSATGLPVTSIAVSDDGASVLAGVSDGSNGSVWLFGAGQAPRQVASAGVPSALRFLAGKPDAIVADSGWRQVSLLSPGATTGHLLAGADQGVTAPVAIEVSTDQQKVWIANASGSGFLTIDLTSGSVTAVDCPFPPARVGRLAGRSVFLVTAEDGATAGLWAPETSNATVWRLTTPWLK